MGMEEFMVCVDRIIASSSSSVTGTVVAEASSVNNNGNGGRENLLLIDAKTDENCGLSFKNEQNRDGSSSCMVFKCQESEKGNCGENRLKGKNGNLNLNLRECRICQEEDSEQDMEVPCACNGTLKVSPSLLFLLFFWVVFKSNLFL